MIVLYIVRDKVIDSDIYTFLAFSEEDAVKQLSDFAMRMGSRDFSLYSFIHLEHDADGDEIRLKDIKRQFVFDIPEEVKK